MFLFGTLDKSARSPIASKIGFISSFSFLYPTLLLPDNPLAPRCRPFHGRSCTSAISQNRHHKLEKMDNIFIQALVRASSCQKHTKPPVPLVHASRFMTTQQKTRRRPQSRVSQDKRPFRTSHAKSSSAQAATSSLTREEIIGLVDHYPDFQIASNRPSPERDRNSGGNISPPADDFRDSSELPPQIPAHDIAHDTEKRHIPRPFEHTTDQSIAEELKKLLWREDSSHEEIFDLYKSLPFPGVSYLSLTLVRRLLHHLSVVERKNNVTMLRYLSVIDDMKAADIPIIRSEWSSAIAFAGKSFSRVTNAEVQSALYIWNQMEQEAGVRSDHVTFNILFDIATKSGKFALADAIIEEMGRRQLKWDRYSRVGMIYYHGVRGDGQSVRKAYRDHVDAGEFVDTIVLNCVMASLIRAGEPIAAEHIFLHMKSLCSAKTGHHAPQRTWREKRKLGTILSKAARQTTHDSEEHRKIQNTLSIAPDNRTFGIILKYYCIDSGNIDRVVELLDEMQHMGIDIDAHIYSYIFRGFASSGGVRYSSWTKDKLESVWAAFTAAVDSHPETIPVDRYLVLPVMHAFAKCSVPERSLEVFGELQRRWQPSQDELDDMTRLLRRIIPPELVTNRNTATP